MIKKKLMTIAITNRALSLVSIGLGVLIKSDKSFDLALETKKIRTKCKSFGYGWLFRSDHASDIGANRVTLKDRAMI